MNDSKVIVKTNPFGYQISKTNINQILNGSDEFLIDHVGKFFGEIKLTDNILERYVEVHKKICNVSIAPVNGNINPKLIGVIASAIRCFCCTEYLACLELCALCGEMLACFLNIISKETRKDFERVHQPHRLEHLFRNGAINASAKSSLSCIHEKRKLYFHRWETKHDDLRNDALNSLVHITCVASEHLEILDESENIDKVKRYLESIQQN